MLRGLMMDMPLLISSLIVHAERCHGDTEIVSRSVEGPIHRYTYADAHKRARQLAQALGRLGVKQGDRIGTLAWNGYRHLELYYGVSGMGAVIHTVNPRLFPEQIEYIVNHAEDAYVFFDLTFAPIVAKLAPQCPGVKGWVAMTDRAHVPQLSVPNLLCYEELIARESGAYEWPRLDEWTASGLCYTSGTTGNPKGVLYAHRSTVIHAFGASLPDVFAASARETILPVVPMFHVNAWGIPYSRHAERLQAGLPRRRARRQEPVRAVRGGAGHRYRGRADRLARPAHLHEEQRPQVFHAPSRHRRRLGGAAGDDQAVRRRVRG